MVSPVAAGVVPAWSVAVALIGEAPGDAGAAVGWRGPGVPAGFALTHVLTPGLWGPPVPSRHGVAPLAIPDP